MPHANGKRELVISRGRTGYIAIYELDKLTDIVVILAIKHQRENAFH
jgi:mRNA-degrading endonuclease RelE of RelBE toxin-antitoxin system